VYWFSVEFGLLVEDGFLRAYGAGLLSSYGELQNSLSGKPEYRRFDPPRTGLQPFPITTFQPVLYVADSLTKATDDLRAYASTLQRVTV
jgi:phenylalanine-4-hydroxylase